jgi:hypothetical protein
MVGTERGRGGIYGGNREEWVGEYMVGTERVSACMYCGNRESEWVYIWWKQRE